MSTSTDPNDPKAIMARSLAGAIRCANAPPPVIVHEPDGIYERAVRAWAQHCDRAGLVYQQPNRASSTFDDGVMVLRNVNGELARFRYDAQRNRLTRIADA